MKKNNIKITDTKELTKIVINAIEDKKGTDIRVIDISEVSVLADYFIIASGSNRNQIQAISDDIQQKMHEAGLNDCNIEGYENAGWILLDYKDIIIHIFDNENRLFYDLERIWRDGKIIDAKDFE